MAAILRPLIFHVSWPPPPPLWPCWIRCCLAPQRPPPPPGTDTLSGHMIHPCYRNPACVTVSHPCQGGSSPPLRGQVTHPCLDPHPSRRVESLLSLPRKGTFPRGWGCIPALDHLLNSGTFDSNTIWVNSDVLKIGLYTWIFRCAKRLIHVTSVV